MSCIYRNSWFESDEFYQICLHSLSCIQVPLHILGTYIIWMKTPNTMGRVKGSMMLLHLTTTWMDIFFTILMMPVVFFPIASLYPLGLLNIVGIPIQLIAYTGYVCIFGLLVAIMISFENRYHYLVRSEVQTKGRTVKRAALFIFNYFISFLSIYIMLDGLDGVNEFREIGHQKLPCLPIEIFEKPNFYMLNQNIPMIASCFLIYCVVIWGQIIFYFIGTSRYLYKTKAVSNRTSQLQKQFFKVLCIQISVPFISIMFPGIYFVSIYISASFDMALTLLGLICITTHGLISTLIMLFAHKPYREATLRLFRMKKWNTAAVSFLVLIPKPSTSHVK